MSLIFSEKKFQTFLSKIKFPSFRLREERRKHLYGFFFIFCEKNRALGLGQWNISHPLKNWYVWYYFRLGQFMKEMGSAPQSKHWEMT